MSLDHMKVFNQYVMPAVIETLAQRVEAFNEASGGAIRLTTEGFDGDFLQESFWASLHTAQRRVDRYATNKDQAPTNLAQLQHNAVKVAGGFGPILFEPGQLTWLRKPTAEGVEVISRNFAEAMLQDQLNSAILALVAAIEARSDATYDGTDESPDVGISYATLNKAHAKFGDRSSALITQVMTGQVAHRLIGQNLTNAERLFTAQGVRVVDILGKLVVITDAPALYEAVSGGPDLEKVLTLTEGAATVFDGSDVIVNIGSTNGKERIETTFQADYTFGLSLKGYAWDTGTGGKSPTDAEIGSGANWDKVVTSIKDTAGVLAVGSAEA